MSEKANLKKLETLDSDLILTIQCKDVAHRYAVQKYINEHLNGNPAYVNSKIILSDDASICGANPELTREELKLPACACVLLYRTEDLTNEEYDALPDDFKIFFKDRRYGRKEFIPPEMTAYDMGIMH